VTQYRAVAAGIAAGAVLGLSMSGAAAGSRHADTPLFGGQPILPGATSTVKVTLPAPQVRIQPYLEISEWRQHCAAPPCSARAPELAQIMQLKAADSAGQAWSGTVAQAGERVPLPGGQVAAGDRRTYSLSLGLPASAGNRYQGLSIEAQLVWAGVDASGDTITLISPKPSGTQVLGEGFTKNSHGSPAGGSQAGDLPFTGLDVIRLLSVATALLVLGAFLVTAARRRRETG
jgi:hypothetical protein